MPSSSPRCAQFPRAQDKVHFYIKLKELRDQLKGLAPGHEVTETDYSFNLQLAKGKQLVRYSLWSYSKVKTSGIRGNSHLSENITKVVFYTDVFV